MVDPQGGLDPYCDEDLHDQDKLEYKYTYIKPDDQIESNDLITDAHLSDALRYAILGFWRLNPHLPDTSPLPTSEPVNTSITRQQFTND